MTGKLKKTLLANLPYPLFVWLFDKLCQAVRLAPGADASEKLLHIAQGFTEAFASKGSSGFTMAGLRFMYRSTSKTFFLSASDRYL